MQKSLACLWCLFERLCDHHFCGYVLTHKAFLLDLYGLNFNVFVVSRAHHFWWTYWHNRCFESKVKANSKADSKSNQKNSDYDDYFYLESQTLFIFLMWMLLYLRLKFQLFLSWQTFRCLILALNFLLLERGFLLH